MKLKHSLWLLAVLVLGAVGGWYAAKHHSATTVAGAAAGAPARLYKCAMHPWITSDKPGRCTICGMELSPVHEGEDTTGGDSNLVLLSSNIVNVIHVQTAPTRRQTLERTLQVAGTVEEDETRHRLLSAYTDGRIEELFINYLGAEVTAGQPLASVYSPALLGAEQEYVLLARGQPGAPGGDATAAVSDQQRLLEAARQRLLRLGLTREQIEALPNQPETEYRTAITAPVSGTVVARFVYAGQYVKEGDRLFELADFSKVWFRFDVYERDLAWLKLGQTVEIVLPSVPGRVFSAPITFVEPVLQDTTRAARARAELENPMVEESGAKRRLLLSRTYAEGLVRVQAPEALAVPRAAVLSPTHLPVVYVEKARGVYEQRLVKLGRTGDQCVEVLEGVSEGERVVIEGNLLVDAQAQLARGAVGAGPTASAAGSQPGEDQTVTAQKLPALAEAQKQRLRELFVWAGALASGLAQDNLAEYNQQAAQAPQVVAAASQTLAGTAELSALMEKVAAEGRLSAASDLVAARKAFLPLSGAVVELAKATRVAAAEFRDLKLYKCPMVSQAWPGAPKDGFWVQLQGPVRNPYFGAEMLECGVELKP